MILRLWLKNECKYTHFSPTCKEIAKKTCFFDHFNPISDLIQPLFSPSQHFHGHISMDAGATSKKTDSTAVMRASQRATTNAVGQFPD
ncbi:hypothetical protein [Paramuribaculum intestinale]|uniref:hypothetical protein n=1 Tax=Paramuribaculum intestinale TaxID=2094151 RepID=UPI0025A94C61|nr:hypothetical protein [Paramuribaculum intestinale]